MTQEDDRPEKGKWQRIVNAIVLYGFVPIIILIGAYCFLFKCSLFSLECVNGKCSSGKGTSSLVIIPSELSALINNLAADLTVISERLDMDTHIPITFAPVPMAVNISTSHLAAWSTCVISCDKGIISEEPSGNTQTSIGMDANSIILLRKLPNWTEDNILGAIFSSIFTLAKRSSSAFWFASAARCSAIAARSIVLAIFRLKYSSLALPARYINNAVTTPTAKLIRNITLAVSYQNEALCNDDHKPILMFPPFWLVLLVMLVVVVSCLCVIIMIILKWVRN